MQLVWEKIGKMGVNGGSRIGDFAGGRLAGGSTEESWTKMHRFRV